MYSLLRFHKVSVLRRERNADVVEIQYFLRLKVSRLPPYQDLLKIGKSRKDAIFLDIGSCCEDHSTRPSPQK